jgi:peptidoglycan/xylan/chitin deacetylase (PgdA/CDA1 family)
MSKSATFVSCGAVAASIVVAGVLVDRLLAAHAIVAGGFVLLAAAYLVGTFSAGSPLFGRVVRGRIDRPEVALTFDDGPDPRFTPTISATLARRGHRGTFFVLGARARDYPHVLSQVSADGHEIASHGDDHRMLAFSPPATVRAQVELAERAVESVLGGPPAPFFRAPHGVRSPWLGFVLRRCGYELCAWDGSVFDTANPGVETIAARVEKTLRPGAIVLLHDGDGTGRGASREQTVAALERILDVLESRSLRSVAMSELVAGP